MNDDSPEFPEEPGDAEMDSRLREAGSRLRTAAGASGAQFSVPARRESGEKPVGDQLRMTRRAGAVAAAAAVVFALSTGALALNRGDSAAKATLAAKGPGALQQGFALSPAQLTLLEGLPKNPIDPHSVKLSAGLDQFKSCTELIARLRHDGAAHVGSRGFNAYPSHGPFNGYSMSKVAEDSGTLRDAGESPSMSAASDETIGTNVQVGGVDEPDSVKVFAGTVVSLRDGRLRVTDTNTKKLLGTLDLPGRHDPNQLLRLNPDEGPPFGTPVPGSEYSILVFDPYVVVFGSEYIESKPIEGDPSATTTTTSYATLTLVDIKDRSKPTISQRVRIEGAMISARLVEDEIRLVTNSNMPDIGFVSPTTPSSIPIALETNRISLAASSVDDWIPNWDTGAGSDEAKPLNDCGDVFVPETFAGMSMTSMTNFKVGPKFEPRSTSIVAPSESIYATADQVAVGATVWVDPIDRSGDFKDWETAVHTFDISTETPSYQASGKVTGSIRGQFSFGTVGDRLAVVSTQGTIWNDENNGENEAIVRLQLMKQEGSKLVPSGQTEEMTERGNGGGFGAVRFTKTRAFVTNGFGTSIRIWDLSDPAKPRRGGEINSSAEVVLIQPVSDDRFVVASNRYQNEPTAEDPYRQVSYLQTELVDASNVDRPQRKGSYEVRNGYSGALYDHRAISPWPSRQLIALDVTQSDDAGREKPSKAIYLSTEDGMRVAAEFQPTDIKGTAPCPTVDSAQFRQQLGKGWSAVVVMRCPAGPTPDFPGYRCDQIGNVYLACYDMGRPKVERIFVIDGKPWLYTSESVERLDPSNFKSTSVVPIG